MKENNKKTEINSIWRRQIYSSCYVTSTFALPNCPRPPLPPPPPLPHPGGAKKKGGGGGGVAELEDVSFDSRMYTTLRSHSARRSSERVDVKRISGSLLRETFLWASRGLSRLPGSSAEVLYRPLVAVAA